MSGFGVVHTEFAEPPQFPLDLPEHRLPAGVQELRDALASGGGVRNMADILEARFGIDVVRVREIGTAYSVYVGARAVIVLRETANWFHENWSMAHEVGHLVAGRASVNASKGTAEAQANAFAAEVLLPEPSVQRLAHVTTAEALGDLIWVWGVSTEAVRRRSDALRIELPKLVRDWLQDTTVSFLRKAFPASRWPEIAMRQRDAATRRFPATLTLAHERAIEEGRLGKGTLAWMLGVDEDAVEVAQPTIHEVDAEELVSMLGLAPA